MAISIENFMGKASGKLGNLIIYQRNGKVCFRSKPKKSKVPPSDRQIYQRKAFSQASTFLAPIRSELEFGFSGITGDKSKRYGKAQSLAVKKATLSDNGEPVLDPEKIQTSIGDLLPLEDGRVLWENANTIQLTWRPNAFEGNGRESDQIFYLAYDPEAQQKWAVLEGVYRKAGSMTIQFPWSGPLEGKFYHFVSFYTKRKGQIEFSDSVCLGRV
ncbi:DUF6266 family protein [Algoriphagus boritolerans]|uniref:Uncharacterized protein n=1 Tax=Algoriphagus boritolerans DSM 17298 = JCM 18970 TaxID=1120964 RepID=A0A1H5XG91_9BACT|nr:DUF6266 family protein [Algoriphagus boritolerans]SEG10762.1 hypothetical protein SAMN03080598_02514 [Algoriphagus boritolerans DSM 17298 = JCM 18970]